MSMFNIPTPRSPSPEEMTKIAKRWWEHHKGCTFKDWSLELRALSYDFTLVSLPKAVIDGLIRYDSDIEAHKHACEKLKRLINANRPEGDFFIKLISRSPKDVWESPRMTDAKTAIGCLVSSERTFDDLCHFNYIPEECYIVLRPYIEIEPWKEFRVMVQDRKIVGISQYFYNEYFPEVAERPAVFEERIRWFVEKLVIPHMTVKDFSADVVWGETIKLLETNPWGNTDPCLFVDYKSFDGTFRYHKSQEEADAFMEPRKNYITI